MRRWRFLLRPGWLVLLLVVVAFAYACFTILAPWQLGKNSSTETRNDRISSALGTDPVPLTEVLGEGVTEQTEWHQVDATGRYLADHDVVLRLRSHDGPAVEVLTPFRLDDGRTILVDRGWVRADQSAGIPDFPAAPSGEVTVQGYLRLDEGTVPGREPAVQDGHDTVYSVDAARIGSVVGLDLTRGYLQAAADQPGVLAPIALPQLDAGPYLSYGLQWLAFGVMAPLGLAYFAWAEIRARRARPRDTDVPAAAAAGEPPSGAADAEGSAPRPKDENTVRTPTTEERLADRYGRTR